jgi:hypothetical protein
MAAGEYLERECPSCEEDETVLEIGPVREDGRVRTLYQCDSCDEFFITDKHGKLRVSSIMVTSEGKVYDSDDAVDAEDDAEDDAEEAAEAKGAEGAEEDGDDDDAEEKDA